MDAETPRQFLDTNVLVYAFDTSAGEKHARSVELLDELAATERGAVSVQVLQEFFVTVTAKVPAPMQPAEAEEIVSNLGAMTTHAPGAHDVLGAIEIHRRLPLSFWDAMIIRSATQLRCEVVWSEDLAHGQRYDGTEVRSPFA